MGLPQALCDGLSALGIQAPTPVQALAIPAALKGDDVLAVSQTGTGKTLAYLLPLLAQLDCRPNSRALILTPSRETADQVFRVMQKLAEHKPISSALVATGVSVADQAKLLRKNPRLIIATPGRIGEHLRSNKLLLQGLQHLVIDEADRMLELGFEQQVKFVISTLRGSRQTMMFAASFGPNAERMAQELLSAEAVRIHTEDAGAPVANLKQTVYFLTWPQKNLRLSDILKKTDGGVIVFTDSQDSCMKVGRWLTHQEFKADFVHGQMQPGHRQRLLREFREHRLQILVTTDVLARGLDIPHVELVINYDLPFKPEDFLHRLGRTARAGRDGQALTFVTPKDGRTYRKIKRYLAGAMEEILAKDFAFDDQN